MQSPAVIVASCDNIIRQPLPNVRSLSYSPRPGKITSEDLIEEEVTITASTAWSQPRSRRDGSNTTPADVIQGVCISVESFPSVF
jgi:hypothetical protein